jgi:RES domain-containing protein
MRVCRLTAHTLDRALTCYRISDPDGAYPIFDATGSRLHSGRWNTSACPMIYASEYYSTAMLEKLVHGSGRMPPNQHYIEITIPNGVSYEMFGPATLSEWVQIRTGLHKPIWWDGRLFK